jgi:hypothetical protein
MLILRNCIKKTVPYPSPKNGLKKNGGKQNRLTNSIIQWHPLSQYFMPIHFLAKIKGKKTISIVQSDIFIKLYFRSFLLKKTHQKPVSELSKIIENKDLKSPASNTRKLTNQ